VIDPASQLFRVPQAAISLSVGSARRDYDSVPQVPHHIPRTLNRIVVPSILRETHLVDRCISSLTKLLQLDVIPAY
jgi:hypothetical protein